MKKLLTISALCFGSVAFAQTTGTKPDAKAAPAQTNQTATNADPGYKFDNTSHDYGTIQKGGEPYCEFHLTNTSKEMLVISEAHGSCGCTIPEYPKEPIKPGQTVVIKVHYDTNRIGPFEKQVTVTFQGKDTPAILHIHGTVQAPPSETPFPGPGSTPVSGGTPVNN